MKNSLFGNRVGSLKIFEESSPPNKSGRNIKHNLCLCDCGEITFSTVQSLRQRDHIQSCHHCATKIAQNAINLTGQEILGLKIFDKSIIRLKNKKSIAGYLCLCKCGEIYYLTTSALSNKINKGIFSCSKCYHNARLILSDNFYGQTFGFLKCFEESWYQYNDRKKVQRIKYILCLCQCGKIVYISHHNLFNRRKSPSCGCGAVVTRQSRMVDRIKQNYKLCKICKRKKSLDHFDGPNLYKKYHDGFSATCNQCNYQKIKTNIQKNLRKNISSYICISLKRRKSSKKNKSFLKYVNFTMEELKNHLESKFQSWMTWDNYGSHWHVDHIIPASWFNYSSLEDSEFKQCWCLANLQPLKAEDNLRKRNSFSG